MSKQRKILKILIILTIVLIWGQSFLPPDMSSGESGFVLEKIVKPFLRFITGREAEISEHLVRKLAHFTEFMVLGLLVALFNIHNKNVACDGPQPLPITYYPLTKNCALRIMHCALFCMFIAFIDESIQMFTGRGPAIADVWIDTGGAVTGIGIEWIIEKCTMRNA